MQHGGLSRRSLFGAALAASAGLAGCGTGDRKAAPTMTGNSVTGAAGDPVAVATDAYIFGYPLVLMDVTREHSGTANALYHARALPTAADHAVVRMNLDTLYTSAWLDLRAEPMVLEVPDMGPDRYWLMQLLDAWTNTAHHPSSLKPQLRQGQSSFAYAIIGPGWSGALPDTVTRLDMPTATAWLIGRTQVNGPDDLDAVHVLQDRITLAPLSAWTAGRAVAVTGATMATGTPPPKLVAELDGPAFFTRMCAVLAANPTATADDTEMKRFAAIGVRPGGSVAGQPVDALNQGVAAAQKRLQEYHDPAARNENGWNFTTNIGSYGTDYALRAATAKVALGANLAEDAIYPSTFGVADANGAPRRYRIRFDAGQLPPVDAFWSITAYGSDSYLVDNPAGIYSIGHLIPVVPGSDGRVTVSVQHEDPGPGVPSGHWLPIPATGAFSLSMRLYAPKSTALDGTWQPPALTPVN
ncbi:DUF1254 domain-containing protein [Nocardia sp. alder85J]|uniref:DUF1254 domain-containing protein n=1 Tax=Nocardia sp. alder85J TaxID=2862949 RepID=UPI001CD6DF17|nr:DUF1254 domain-containing protein [Nocardia sp. alder85J]MCX4098833.1 DUF1254 domain-containing protein [Nocardia sp. alder85J]